MKTVFVVFRKTNKVESEGSEETFVCVRRSYEKAAKEARKIKPALVLEVNLNGEGEQVIERCAIS